MESMFECGNDRNLYDDGTIRSVGWVGSTYHLQDPEPLGRLHNHDGLDQECDAQRMTGPIGIRC